MKESVKRERSNNFTKKNYLEAYEVSKYRRRKVRSKAPGKEMKQEILSYRK